MLTRKFTAFTCSTSAIKNLILLANGPLPLLLQCWLSVVQGNTLATQMEAIKVSIHTFLDPRLPYFTAPPLFPSSFPLSLSYLGKHSWQLYNTRLTSGTGLKSTPLSDFAGQSVSNRNGPPYTKRTQSSLLSPFSSSSDFLPLNYASVKGAEEKIYAEHQKLKGYTRLQAQDSYISTTCASPAYNTVFFHCQVCLYVQCWAQFLSCSHADKHLWRNRLARSAVNRKVAGSSPARCDFFSLFAPLEI